MRFLPLICALLLVTGLAQASDVRDLLNADTRAKRATFSYRQKMNFMVVSGPRDGLVTLRAFRGTRASILRDARAWAPDCARVQHLVFGGWWVTGRRITFNDRFGDWALPADDGDGKWVFVFDVQPASARLSRAGFLGVQELQVDQAMIEEYFNTGLEVTVTNTRPVVSSRSTPLPSPSVPVDVAARELVPRGTTAARGPNVIPTPVFPPLVCTIQQHVLPETTLLATGSPRERSAIVLARRGEEPASAQQIAAENSGTGANTHAPPE